MLKKKDRAINIQIENLERKVAALEKVQMRLIKNDEMVLELITLLTEKIWGKWE